MLYHRPSHQHLVSVRPDTQYRGMFRVLYSNGKLSDLVNLTRAKDAAVAYALLKLNSHPQGSACERATAHQKPFPLVRPPSETSPAHEARRASLAILDQER